VRAALAAVAVGLLVLPGCGSSESGFASIPDSGEQFPGEVMVDARIDMREIEFAPESVRVAAGSTVSWVNRDAVAHTIVMGTDIYNEFTSGEVEPGATYSRTFDKTGEVEYRCTIHASMAGALNVER
jgi:plastocyanin